MPFIKLLAATHFPGPAFRHRADYAELWRRMRGEFPLVFSAVIMPDHVHVTLETKNEEETQAAVRVTPREARALAEALLRYARTHRDTEDQ
jgi:REP element-mobilizing transposase RayT